MTAALIRILKDVEKLQCLNRRDALWSEGTESIVGKTHSVFASQQWPWVQDRSFYLLTCYTDSPGSYNIHVQWGQWYFPKGCDKSFKITHNA